MAINDNDNYTLTGAQVKDLASKINDKADSSSLATVATTGAYSDLSGTPTIPTKTSDLTNDGSDGTSTYVEADELATVATSGSYNDLLNTPTIPAAQVNSDWDAASGVAQILNKPTLAAVATSGAYSDLSGTPTLATVATSGDYGDLLNKPTIPAAQVNSDWNANSGVAEILNKPSLATVATSGSYNDLSNKPTIPDAVTVIYMVKTVDSGSHDYTVVFYTDLAHTTTVSYSDVNYDVVEGKSVYIVDGGNAFASPLSAINGSPKGSGDMNAVVDNSLYKFSIVSGTIYLDVQGIIHADPIQSTAALTPLVQTNMIANGAVTYDKLDTTTMKTSATTLWSGTLYQTGASHAVTLSEALVAGDVYVITAYGLSSSYLMEFVCTYRNNYYQAMYYDGSNYCRWRINFTNNGTKMELDSASTNMGTNTAIIRIAKIGLSSTS